MKELCVVHINEGNNLLSKSEPFFLMEEFPRTSQVLADFAARGFRIINMVKDVNPNINQEGSWSFFNSGYTFLLERETPEGDSAEDTDPDAFSKEEDVDESELLEEFDFSNEL